MKTTSVLILIGCAAAGLAFADAPASSVSQTVQQIEKDWGAAEKTGDADKVGQILADDWTALDPWGKKLTKADFVADVKTGKMKVDSMEWGPMDVKVLGNVAVVQGSDTEKSMYQGKDSSGKYVWTDVFAKRDGKWVVVRSQITMLK